ncbi:bifunctional 2-polyprenyl-6-hydroxyphenol methylase/3-demethylubiquinol 3-O-methyltransferase UbiG [Sphingomonas sp. AX6]|uniref:bifunctional 2-polyprenyl-6-hydroxyphenol methylase/3-demethylubiquinol 3-O-methyltransferase UbiG n=1 Tax=Sphingomonas sp. AX6 TaxID=2653171 RepID=UPI0012F2F552|nr:bifunctional 2-polyprenyl-6-hydroxyphenol methylase/3-demethylubiquinol 3-O-methyltransferase UbiG [Sphingomonas sp. AX6]VXC54243.1 Ubiquinone biosynthesis O-methyltransferase [Sphingomonas sp. AX6]
MTVASITPGALAAATSTIDAREAEHFGTLAADWWNPKGSSAMLHKLNPPRLRYLREAIDEHWGSDSNDFTPLGGKTAIDVGCGAGLLTEPLARLGARVTGLDAAQENIGAARAHANSVGLNIDYRHGGIEALSGEAFDLVTSMEVIEHVSDVDAFIAGLERALAPGGLMILSTPNRTPLSRLAMITIGEGAGIIPEGTHDWERFLTPDELTDRLEAAGLRVANLRGLSFSPMLGFHISDDTSLDYLLTATWR